MRAESCMVLGVGCLSVVILKKMVVSILERMVVVEGGDN